MENSQDDVTFFVLKSQISSQMEAAQAFIITFCVWLTPKLAKANPLSKGELALLAYYLIHGYSKKIARDAAKELDFSIGHLHYLHSTLHDKGLFRVRGRRYSETESVVRTGLSKVMLQATAYWKNMNDKGYKNQKAIYIGINVE